MFRKNTLSSFQMPTFVHIPNLMIPSFMKFIKFLHYLFQKEVTDSMKYDDKIRTVKSHRVVDA